MEWLSELERSHVRLKGCSPLLQTVDGQAISHSQIVLVVALMDIAIGRPGALGATTAATSVGGKAALLSYKAKRRERGQPVKPVVLQK